MAEVSSYGTGGAISLYRGRGSGPIRSIQPIRWADDTSQVTSDDTGAAEPT